MTSPESRSIAILGLGAMGLRYVEAIKELVGFRLAAVCDRNPNALRAPQLAHSVARYSSPQALFANGPYDLVIVATTAPSHKELVLAAIDVACPAILCEKPLACSVADADEMIRAAAAASARLCVNHARRFIPEYKWLATMIKNNTWGQVRSISASIPGIGLGCIGPHIIDLVRFLSGEEWRWVSGWVDEPLGPNPRGPEYRDPGGLVVGGSDQGTRFLYHQLECAAGPSVVLVDLTDARITIDEWSGTIDIVLARVTPTGQRKYDRDLPPALQHFKPNVVHASAALLRGFVAASSDESFPCDAINGLRSLEVIVAAYSSHDLGHRPVTVPLTEPITYARCLSIT